MDRLRPWVAVCVRAGIMCSQERKRIKYVSSGLRENQECEGWKEIEIENQERQKPSSSERFKCSSRNKSSNQWSRREPFSDFNQRFTSQHLYFSLAIWFLFFIILFYFALHFIPFIFLLLFLAFFYFFR